MSEKRTFGWKHAAASVAVVALVLVLVLAFLAWSGVMDRWARRAIIAQIEKATGARVEIEQFHFGLRSLRARFDGLTVHGREPAGTPPLFHAGQLQVDIRVESIWGRKISRDFKKPGI